MYMRMIGVTKMMAITWGVMTASVSGFLQGVKPSITTFNYVGDLKPTGYFDPAGLSETLSEADVKWLRESELAHGRAAMSAFVGLVLLDVIQDDLAINVLYKQNWETQLPFWFGVACYEFSRMGAGWKNPFLTGKLLKLEDHYQPGNVFKLENNTYNDALLNRELSNSRLAMLGTLGYMAQELIQQQQIF